MSNVYRIGRRVELVEQPDSDFKETVPIDPIEVESDWEGGNSRAPMTRSAEVREWFAELWARFNHDRVGALLFWLSVALFLSMPYAPQIARWLGLVS